MSLIFTDRSRYITKLSNCQMAAYLGYHYKDVGIRRKGLAMPLATGSYVHGAFEDVLTKILNNEVVDDTVIQSAINTSMAEYADDVTARGFDEIPDSTNITNQMSLEQTWLVGGLSWTWFKRIMPSILEQFELVAIEQEYEKILGCSCGLSGLGAVQDHHDRGCYGVVLMTRPDIIARDLSTGALSYHEFKTGATVANAYWGADYEDNIQFAMCTAAASAQLDEPINEFYVHGLHKGYRKSDAEGIRRQVSPFCYAYVKHAVPPMTEMEVRPYYTWVDEDGKNRKVGKNHIKTPVWEIPGVNDVRDYIALLSDDDLNKNVKVIGPFASKQPLIDQLLKEMYWEELDWHARITNVRDEVVNCGDEFCTAVLDTMTEMIPRSWACHPYQSDCEYKPICYQHEGWDEPLDMTNSTGGRLFELREPNHPIEKMNGLWK